MRELKHGIDDRKSGRNNRIPRGMRELKHHQAITAWSLQRDRIPRGARGLKSVYPSGGCRESSRIPQGMRELKH